MGFTEDWPGSCVQWHHVNIGAAFAFLSGRAPPAAGLVRAEGRAHREPALPRTRPRDLTSLSTSRGRPGLGLRRYRVCLNHRLGEIEVSPQDCTGDSPGPRPGTHADQGSSSCALPHLLPEKPPANFPTSF